MYYLSKKEFHKQANKIYNLLFSGFTFFNCQFENKENKYKEHFAHLPTCEEMEETQLPLKNRLQVKKDRLKKLEKESEFSSTYNMPREKRMLHVLDSLAVTYGFKSYYDYKNKTRFRKDIKALTPAKEMFYDVAKTRTEVLKNELINRFNFKTGLFIPATIIETAPENNYSNSLIEEKYKNEEEFYNALAYMLNGTILTTKALKELDESINWETLKKQLAFCFDLTIETERYAQGNDKNLFLRMAKKRYPDKDFSFMSKIEYSYEVFRISENILTLSEEDFEIFLELANDSFYEETVYLFELVRNKNKNEYMKFMIKLSKLM